MNYILYDDPSIRLNLLPLTFTRPIADIRIGILTIREKWEYFLKQPVSIYTEAYLSKKHPCVIQEENIMINASILPTSLLVEEIKKIVSNEALVHNTTSIAFRLHKNAIKGILSIGNITFPKTLETTSPITQIIRPWNIFTHNANALHSDFEIVREERISSETMANNTIIGDPKKIFIEKGAIVRCTTINTEAGPVYIGKDAEIMEGSMIRGPVSIGENATVKMGSKLYGATTIGPHCKVGGEINNSVFLGYSNKAHDGFIGNSVIGEWCNLGADTNNSNLKNNYSNVKVWSYANERLVDSEIQFLGLIMGDHCKCSINTMFNTGTVAGVCANIFGHGFPPKFIPSFSWGGSEGLNEYRFENAIETARRIYDRRNKKLKTEDEEILNSIFQATAKYRNRK